MIFIQTELGIKRLEYSQESEYKGKEINVKDKDEDKDKVSPENNKKRKDTGVNNDKL